MTTTREVQITRNGPVLHMALELGLAGWKLAFTVGLGQASRLRSVRARDQAAVLDEIAKAKERFGLPADAPVVSCYEAGRDGFWVHRWLVSVGVSNHVVDSASIEVNRKKRRAKDDGLDADSLVRLLVRYCLGEKKVWSVVRVPSPEAEDRRRLHRELLSLKDERTRLINQMKGLLIGQGVVLRQITAEFLAWLSAARCADGSPVPPELQAELQRTYERWQLLQRQINGLETEQRRRIRNDATPEVEMVRQLLRLRGIGRCGAWMLVKELFGWRQIANRKQLGGLLGLTPTPYTSGTSRREQGISKAGNKRLRRLMIELAWSWRRLQPGSELSLWFERRFGQGPRQRRLGIVALARKLVIALWRYLTTGEVPRGVITLVSWESKVNTWAATRAQKETAA
jgi:transposase